MAKENPGCAADRVAWYVMSCWTGILPEGHGAGRVYIVRLVLPHWNVRASHDGPKIGQGTFELYVVQVSRHCCEEPKMSNIPIM